MPEAEAGTAWWPVADGPPAWSDWRRAALASCGSDARSREAMLHLRHDDSGASMLLASVTVTRTRSGDAARLVSLGRRLAAVIEGLSAILGRPPEGVDALGLAALASVHQQEMEPEREITAVQVLAHDFRASGRSDLPAMTSVRFWSSGRASRGVVFITSTGTILGWTGT
jgi:hypothetical protein